MVVAAIQFRLRNQLSEIKRLEEKVDGFCSGLGLTKKCFCEINLVLEELFTNIVSYGYRDDAEHWVQFALAYENETITLRIEDDGMPFNPVEAREPDVSCALEERRIGGLGIHLIKKIMDDIIYRRCGDKNILTLKKVLPAN